MDLHGLLLRQVKRHLGSEHIPADLEALLGVISNTYREFDSDRALVERSLDLASQELLERNKRLQEDVETQIKTERQLKEALSALQSTLDSTADGILVVSVDSKRKVTLINQRFLEMWNVPKEVAHTGLSILEFVIDQLIDPDQAVARIDEIRSDPASTSFDVMKLIDGRVFERSSMPQLIDGSPVGLVWSFRDVTERFNAQLALQRSEEHFRSLIENGSDIILVLGTDSGIRYASPSVSRMLGYDAASLQDVSALSLVHADDLIETRRYFERTILGAGEEAAFEIRVRHKDGSWRIMEATSQRVMDDPQEKWSVVVNCRDITERKRAEDTIRFLAYHDALTGLPNRELLRDRLDLAISQARRNSERLAVMYVDLDRFKDVNDSVGHAGGDDLLRAVSERLSNISREGDTVARIGGDEFVLLMPQVEDVQDSVKYANRVLDAFREPQSIDNRAFHVTASVGLSLYPDDGQESEVLLRNADIAMYRAKEQGGNKLQLYEPSMNASILARLSLEQELRQAEARGELVLYYQPVADVAMGQILGAEALIRWNHPIRGLINPIEFIPIAEDTGLILPIGAWILRTACKQAAIWERQWPGFCIAVNVSARQLQQREFVSVVSDALWISGLSAGALELEVTETVAMANTEWSAQVLRALQGMGIRPVIDDFGTGYSSLSHLKCLPVFKLKIDRSFIKDIPEDGNDVAIASATIAMAHSLNLTVTAEGVETEAQLELLRDRGCDEYQGYLLSRPRPADELTRMLEARREHAVSV